MFLMRRLDALAPYKLGLEAISDWTRRDPLAASAINRVVINSMRFMLEAAGIESEGPRSALLSCKASRLPGGGCCGSGFATTILGLPQPWQSSTAN